MKKFFGFVFGGAMIGASVGYWVGAEARIKVMAHNFNLAKRLATKWAETFNHVTAATVLTICKIESDFNPTAENHNERAEPKGGAWGMMQITLDTARDLIKKVPRIFGTVGVWDGSGKSLLDPDLNIMLGTFYLDKLAQEFGGDFDKVVAAYQQGPGTVRKVVAAGNFPDGLGPNGRTYLDRAQAVKTQIDTMV